MNALYAGDVKHFDVDAYRKLDETKRTFSRDLFRDLGHIFSRSVQYIEAEGGDHFFGDKYVTGKFRNFSGT
jgi:hypothetical protein